jgi:hypothetical protein
MSWKSSFGATVLLALVALHSLREISASNLGQDPNHEAKLGLANWMQESIDDRFVKIVDRIEPERGSRHDIVVGRLREVTRLGERDYDRQVEIGKKYLRMCKEVVALFRTRGDFEKEMNGLVNNRSRSSKFYTFCLRLVDFNFSDELKTQLGSRRSRVLRQFGEIVLKHKRYRKKQKAGHIVVAVGDAIFSVAENSGWTRENALANMKSVCSSALQDADNLLWLRRCDVHALELGGGLTQDAEELLNYLDACEQLRQCDEREVLRAIRTTENYHSCLSCLGGGRA